MFSTMQDVVYFCLIVICIPWNATGKKKETEPADFIAEEIKILGRAADCQRRQKTKDAVHDLWLKDQVADGTVLCILKFLEANIDHGFMWSLLGNSYDSRQAKQKSDFCFKQASKHSGKYSKFIREWHYIGPFVIGKTEFDGDPTASFGGIRNVSKYRLDSSSGTQFFSELIPGGVVKWTVLKQTQDQEMIQAYPKLDWNDLVSTLGSLAITEWQGWAVGDLVINEDNLALSYQCLGVGYCVIGDHLITGDLYHRKTFWCPVTLSRGVHSVFIPLRTKVAAKFKFSIAKMQKFEVLDPPFLPDIYDGHLTSNSYLSVPIANLMAKKWLKVSKVVLMHQSHEVIQKPVALRTLDIAPGQTRPVIIQLKDGNSAPDDKIACTDVDIELQIKTSEGTENLKVTLRCRNKGSSFLYTFLDHDGSVQHAAAIEPLGSCDSDLCPVMLTLHGTTVPPQNQADSYKKMVKGEYQFGVDKMWLLAPTRHGAHNWEGPGTLTAMTAVHALHDITESATWLQSSADPFRIFFAGHSMGGHGAWHLATHYPDRAIGLVSLAGWIKKEEYGDSNEFFRHDIATSHTNPAVKAVMEACIAENDADKHVTNLKGIPVLARIGAKDRTVHPYYVRRMVRLLREVGVNVTYSELPGLEHWWWDSKETNDGGCVNDAEIRRFMSQITNSLPEHPAVESGFCGTEKEKCDEAPANKYTNPEFEQVTLATVNPALGGGLKGVRVIQQIIPMRMSTVEIKVIDDILALTTQNVKCLEVGNYAPNRGINYAVIRKLTIDGSSVQLKTKEFPHTICLTVSEAGPVWEHVQDLYSSAKPGLIRGPHNFGPARHIAERELLIVVGTQGDQATTEILLRHAVYIANQFYLTSDAFVPVVQDKDVDETTRESVNLIILGTPDENLLAGEYLKDLQDIKFTPATDGDGPKLRLGNLCSYESTRTGLLTLTPHGKDRLAMVVMGLSHQAMEDVVKLATPTIPPMARSPFSNLLPDFVITGPDVDLKGPGGFLCAGFWDNNWRFSAASSSCACRDVRT